MLRFRNRAVPPAAEPTSAAGPSAWNQVDRRRAAPGRRTNEQLAVRWWEWLAQASQSNSPVADETGACADLNQPNDVWFLSNSYGGEVHRECEVPAGRPIFFPILNSLSNDDEDSFSFMYHAEVDAFLNDTRVECFTIVNATGTITSEVDNPVTKQPGSLAISASGYFVRLVGLTPGTHTISFCGSIPGFGLDMSYRITAS